MEQDIAISVKNLSKKYRLYDSPKHQLKEALNPFRKKYHRDFWAAPIFWDLEIMPQKIQFLIKL